MSDVPTPYMLAGPGLLRSGNTLAVNPNLKLQTLQIRDKISIPNPQDTYDAANRFYVDNAISQNGLMAGKNMLLTDSRQITLADDIAVATLKLTGTVGSDPSSAVPKSYVDATVQPLATKTYVDTAVQGMAKQSDITSAIEPFATRTYVTSYMGQFVAKDDLSSAIAPFARSDDVAVKLNNKADLAYVQSVLSKTVTSTDLDSRIAPLVSKSYVDDSIAPLASKDSVTQQIRSTVSDINSNVDGKISQAVSGLASTSYVNTYVDNVAKTTFSTTYVDEKIAPLATKAQVNSLVVNLAEESYVDDAVAPLASKTYVDDAVEDVSNRVSTYVDKTVSAATFPVVYPVQYSTPSEGDTVESDGRTLLLLDPKVSLSNLTIISPTDTPDGKYFIVTSSQEVSNVTWEGLTAAGSISSPGKGLSAGIPKKFVYSTKANAWFTL